MKKSIITILCFLLLVSSVGMVYSANLTSHDFGNFTMNIPEDASLEEQVEMMAGTVVNNVFSGDIESGIQKAAEDPKNTHPVWVDNNTNLTIGYYDLKEDNITSVETFINNTYDSSATLVSNESNVYVYDISNSYDQQNNSYIICKMKDGFLFSSGDAMVTVSGNDVEQLKTMINTLEFK